MTFKLGSAGVPPSEWPNDLRFLYTEEGRKLAVELDLTVLSSESGTPDVLLEFDDPIPANREHAANVKALTEVLGYVTFIVDAYEDNGTLFGYWHGPEATPMNEAPIVSYDSEGTISLESGESLFEVLVCKACYEDDERFAALKSRLAAHGVEISATSWKNWGKARPCPTDPEKLHNELYERNKA